MPERGRTTAPPAEGDDTAAPVRSFWSGTLTFGLVNIPVDLFAAARPRQKSMKMVDKEGHALGRQYHCSQEGKQLSSDDLVRGYETDSGEMVVITDEELESVAPETSRDIELRRFVPFQQIPPMHFDRPYFLAPAGRSAKAYHLLARTMERTQRAAIGAFVMRGHEYLVAILSENGVLRAETLRHADEIRTPQYVGLPARSKVPSKRVSEFVKAIDALTRDALDMAELEDRDAQALQAFAQSKQKKGEDVVQQAPLQDEDAEEGGAEVIDLMAVLRKSLSRSAVVSTAREPVQRAEVADLAARRKASAARGASSGKRSAPRSKSAAKDVLANASKSDLYKRAAELDIAGRSKMDRAALLKAIRRAS